MKKMFTILFVALMITSLANAAFIVETDSSGLGFSNFTGTPRYTSYASSSAAGITSTMSAFGDTQGTAVTFHQYIFAYTPGKDIDNYTPAAGTALGNANTATGLAGGTSGYYNVYITWPASTNVSSNCSLTITNAAASVVLTDINMNTGGTGSPGANNAWFKIGSQVLLDAETTYYVTQQSENNTYVSLRSSGVMWEYVAPVPEPATIALLGIGTLILRRRR